MIEKIEGEQTVIKGNESKHITWGSLLFGGDNRKTEKKRERRRKRKKRKKRREGRRN